MYTSLMNPRDFAAWEQDPSTRESIRLLTKAYPVDSTLVVSGTAQDLITVAPGITTVNMITNPSMETANPPTGYSAVRTGALSRSNTIAKYGSYSLKIIPPDVVRGEGAMWTLGAYPTDEPLAVSAYFSDNAASGKDARVELFAITTPISDVSNVRYAVGNTVTFAGAGWYRSMLSLPPKNIIIVMRINTIVGGPFVEDETITGSLTGVTATVRHVGTGFLIIEAPSGMYTCEIAKAPITTESILGASSGATANIATTQRSNLNQCSLGVLFVTATKHGTAFYVDGAQAEDNFMVTDYCDGAQGYYNWWDGVAHASTSRRWRKLSSIRSMRLHTSRDVYVAYDQVANRLGVNPEDRGEFLSAGTDFGENSNIYLNKRISFVNVNAGELPRITGLIWGV